MNALSEKQKDNLLLLQTMYGKIRKISDTTYITDIEGADVQKLININTGEVLVERRVVKLLLPGREGLYSYSDFIERGKEQYGLIYIHANKYSSLDGCFRIYNSIGKCILKQHIKDGYTYVNEYVLTNGKLLILIKRIFGGRTLEQYYIIYDKEKEIIKDIEYYTSINLIKHKKKVMLQLELENSEQRTYKLVK